MGATTQLTDFSDLYTDLMNRMRERTSVTAVANQAKRYINVANHDIHLGHGERFWWAQREASLLLRPPYTTGTLTVTRGSTTVTASVTASSPDDFGIASMRQHGKLVVGSGNTIYEVFDAAATNITLTSPYVDEDASGLSFTYFEDEYVLPNDFLKPLDKRQFSTFGGHKITLVGRSRFREMYPANRTAGKPTVASLLGRFNGVGPRANQFVQFHPYPDAYMRVPYRYVTQNLAFTAAGGQSTDLSSDTDRPAMPLQYRHVLVLYALYLWYRDRRNDVQRSLAAKSEYEQAMNRILSDAQIGGNRPGLRPAVGIYREKARRPWRAGGRRYDTDGRFDRFEI